MNQAVPKSPLLAAVLLLVGVAAGAAQRDEVCAAGQWRQIEGLLYERPARVDDVLNAFLDARDPRAPTPQSMQQAASYAGGMFTMASAGYRPLDASIWSRVWNGSNGDPPRFDFLDDLVQLERLLATRATQHCVAGLAPVRKLLEQHAYWELHAALRELPPAVDARLAEVSRSLHRSVGELLRQLRFTDADFRELDRSARQYDLLSQIYKELGAPARAPLTATTISDTNGVTVHAQVTHAPCYFDSYAVVDRRTHAAALDGWLRFTQLTHRLTYETPRPDVQPALMRALPKKPPDGTLLLLVRRPLVLDEFYRLRPVELIERVSVRRYERGENRAPSETYAVYELDARHAARNGELRYAALDMRAAAWGGLLGGAPDSISFQGRTAVTPINNNCASCHNFASPGAGDIFSDGGMTVAGSTRSQSDLTVAYFESAQAPAYSNLLRELRQSVPVAQ